MKVECQEIKKSHYYSLGDSIIIREIETKVSGTLPLVQYQPMVSHEVEDVVSYISVHSGHRCHVIEDGIYFEAISAGKNGSLILSAIVIELPQDRAEEVYEIIKALETIEEL